MHTLFVTVDVRSDKVDAFIAAATVNATASLRDEPGCLAFDIHRDNENPTRFYFCELYTDEDALLTGHRNAPHFLHWQEQSKEILVEGGRQVTHAQPIHLGSTPG